MSKKRAQRSTGRAGSRRARKNAPRPAPRAAVTGRSRGSPPADFVSPAYGRDRVRAVAVDPEWLYVYWEVTEEARELAKSRLGPQGTGSCLVLRVYDTTGRLFDGTNAHSHFDHRIHEGVGQWFFDIRKPGSDAFVEIGVASAENHFVRIARSGRASFPPREPALYREPEWLTVRTAGELHSGEQGRFPVSRAAQPLQSAEGEPGLREEGESSKSLLFGGSERRFPGASEKRLGGASRRG